MDFYGTLGPSCQEEAVLFQMFQEGMTGLRLNLSHKSLVACSDWVAQMHRAAARAGVKAQLLIDLQGPELRVDQFEEPLMLEEGQLTVEGRVDSIFYTQRTARRGFFRRKGK